MQCNWTVIREKAIEPMQCRNEADQDTPSKAFCTFHNAMGMRGDFNGTPDPDEVKYGKPSTHL